MQWASPAFYRPRCRRSYLGAAVCGAALRVKCTLAAAKARNANATDPAMTALGAIELLFPAVLGLHTLEEFRLRDAFLQGPALKWVAPFLDSRTLGWAAVLMVLAATALCLLAVVGANPVAAAGAKAAIFALMFNAFGHGLGSLVRGRPVPGTLSAMALVLPYSAAALATLRLVEGEPTRTLLAYAAAGAIGMPLAAAVFLAMGRVASIPMRHARAAHGALAQNPRPPHPPASRNDAAC